MTVQNGTQWNIDGEELREEPLPHLALDTLDEVIETVCDGLKQRDSDPQRLRSLTSLRYFRLASENAGWYQSIAMIPDQQREDLNQLVACHLAQIDQI